MLRKPAGKAAVVDLRTQQATPLQRVMIDILSVASFAVFVNCFFGANSPPERKYSEKESRRNVYSLFTASGHRGHTFSV
jgi:hypothetical protein